MAIDTQCEPLDSFQKLVKVLRDTLGPSSGINSDDIDERELQNLMKEYTSNESEWKKYYHPSPRPEVPYTRNLVDKGNGNSNLLILVWSPGKQSPIHDHANAHCIMKILKGSLVETRYAWPTDENHPLETISTKAYHENEVTYMSDKLGLHRISNSDPDNYAVSLHLYTPPNAAEFGCNTYNEQTGQSNHIPKCTVYSEYGQRREGRL